MDFFTQIKYKFRMFTIAEKIISINILIFVFLFFVKTFSFLFGVSLGTLTSFLELPSTVGTFLLKPWTLLTYGFLHSDFSHILWNMLLLYYASRLFLNLFSEKLFVDIYFLGILMGGVFFILSYTIFPVFNSYQSILIGASAGVMAVLIFVCTYTPNQQVYLLFFPVKLMYVGIGLVLLDIIQIPNGNAGGQIAHLGGALLGYVYANQLLKGNDIGIEFRKFRTYFIDLFKGKGKFRTVNKSKKKKPSESKDKNQEKIDTILEKISSSGYDSLSKDEKDFLFKAGNK